eukprot:m.346574 g.346574  ORF g.346574 m.346574 type:complete len:625 (-) comp55836_c1_seq1:134-2008(-)
MSSLGDQCASVLGTLPSWQPPHEHLASFLARNKVTDEDDAVFISEVFEGCLKYKTLLQILLKGFFVREGATALKADQPIYHVLSYLALFRLDELGVDSFHTIVVEMNSHSKMLKILKFLSNTEHFETWIRDEWRTVYDRLHVETVILKPYLGSGIRSVASVCAAVESLLNDVPQQHVSTTRTTQPQPFRLTQPKPRSIPIPEALPAVAPTRDVPPTTYASPIEQEALARKRSVNREHVAKALEESTLTQFACANTELSEKTLQRREMIQREQEEKSKYIPAKHRPAPVVPAVTTKLNAAAIMREEAFFRKQMEEEARRMAALEAGDFDSNAFMKWQEEERAREQQSEYDEIERKHLSGLLSREEAVLAKQASLRNRANIAANVKLITANMMQKYAAVKAERDAANRRLVEQTTLGYQNVKDAKEKMIEEKTKQKEAVDGETRALMAAAEEQARIERERRDEIIRQIRALELVPVSRSKTLDLTETSNIGLLTEMSYHELQERLAYLKTKQAEEEEKRRQEILQTKQAKEEILQDKLSTIARARAQSQRLKQDQPAPVPPKPSANPDLVAMREQLQQKRAARVASSSAIPDALAGTRRLVSAGAFTETKPSALSLASSRRGMTSR